MKRWWGIRHIRWWFWNRRIHQVAKAWGDAGLSRGVPPESELRYLDAVWSGKA